MVFQMLTVATSSVLNLGKVTMLCVLNVLNIINGGFSYSKERFNEEEIKIIKTDFDCLAFDPDFIYCLCIKFFHLFTTPCVF